MTDTASLASTRSQTNPMSTLRGVSKSSSDSQIKEVSKQFEQVFIKNMLQPMFDTVESGGTWGSGTGSDAWKSMLVDQYAQSISESGGIGIADSVERQLLQLQEGL